MLDFKKAFCIILIMCIIFMTALAGCSRNDEPSNILTVEGGGGGTLDDDIPADSLEARKLVSDGIPALDFGGADFRIVTQTHEAGNIRQDEATGDTVKDTIYDRTIAVEERFNIKLVTITGTYTENNEYVTKVVMANDDAFDFMYGQGVATSELVQKGLMLSWDHIPYVDFSKPWWASSTIDDLSVKGKTYLAIGDFSLTAQSCTYCMYYNKLQAEKYALPDIYEVVNKGQWTIDKLLELTKNIYEDVNGDGVKDSDDFYGFSADPLSNINAYLWAFDNPVMKKDAEGIPQFVLKTEKMPNIIDKIRYLYFENPGSWSDINDAYSAPVNSGAKLFSASRCVFVSTGLWYANSLRSLEEDYGIIPYPKWNETQERYQTMSDGGMSLFAIPITAPDLEMVGAVTEVLNAESWKYVIPAYYDIALKVKGVRDEQSIEMLELVVAGRVYDFGYIYDNWQGLSFIIEWVIHDPAANFESYYAKNESRARKHYEDIVNVFLE